MGIPWLSLVHFLHDWSLLVDLASLLSIVGFGMFAGSCIMVQFLLGLNFTFDLIFYFISFIP